MHFFYSPLIKKAARYSTSIYSDPIPIMLHIKNLIHSFKNGLGLAETSILFSIAPATTRFEDKTTGELNDATMDGDVFVARCNALDLAMWEIGGAAVSLRLVQLANVSGVLRTGICALSELASSRRTHMRCRALSVS